VIGCGGGKKQVKRKEKAYQNDVWEQQLWAKTTGHERSNGGGFVKSL
jgi:hypothetical protein